MARSDRIPNSKATVGATRRISAITIGVRHRRDLGDIEGLAASIAEVGLLHPVVITPSNVRRGEGAPGSCRPGKWARQKERTGSGKLPTPVMGRAARGQS